MIAVVETIMGRFSHEMFNAGMLCQLHNVYPDEKIVYFCEKEQAKYIKKILDEHGYKDIVEFSYINRIYENFDKDDIAGNKKEYIHIFKKCLNARFVVILTMGFVNSGLVKNFARKFHDLEFGICVNGDIENILPQNEVKFERSFKIFNAIREYKKKKIRREYFNNNINEIAKLSNCKIILYSDVYKEYREHIDKYLYQNIKVLNLPYPFSYNKKPSIKNKVFRIGIMPSSAAAKDQNCIKIIQYMNKQKNRIRYPYTFLIFNHYIGKYENVKYINSLYRTRKDVEHFMESCDWMLIPYDENKYILSSSGVQFDSIEAEKPFFVLGSPSFCKAISGGCGIQEYSIESLGEKIIQQINNENENYERYCEHVRNYKKSLEKENLESIAAIFSGNESVK